MWQAADTPDERSKGNMEGSVEGCEDAKELDERGQRWAGYWQRRHFGDNDVCLQSSTAECYEVNAQLST